MSSELTYEAALEELNTILEDMRQGALNMDELQAKAKRAQELIQYCRHKLRSTEGVLEALLKSSEG